MKVWVEKKREKGGITQSNDAVYVSSKPKGRTFSEPRAAAAPVLMNAFLGVIKKNPRHALESFIAASQQPNSLV